MLKHLTATALAALLALSPLTAGAQTDGGTFTTGKGTFLLNGEPFVVKAAELHYPRIPRPYWEHRIKMCKALGMNTVCLYVFWNIHEQREGVFDFSGNNDVAEFCRLAQKNGMYVIVRPGPYVCAEWEMGGLPWWLLKKKDIRLREPDPYFMERVRIFEQKVGEQLAPLTIQNGGPIIMVQVENEYGAYGEDKAYVSAIRDIVRASGFDKVELFQCDWASNFTKNGLDDLTWTMNFGTGSNIDDQFRRLGELRPDAPKMCSEFWSGWFDKWGARHETRDAKDMVAGIDEMLSKCISFSLYMTHGGTSFGHWAGSNSPGYQPDVTSYDYDAPINEYGQPTPKFHTLRSVMAKYADKKLPSIPKSPMPLISVPEFTLTEHAELWAGADTVATGGPFTFEDVDMGWGSMLYVATMPVTPVECELTLAAHDFAQVYIDGQYVGKIDRSRNETSVSLPANDRPRRLAILVEGTGRINFGRAIKDYKGIVGDVTLTYPDGDDKIVRTIGGWTNVGIPDSYEQAIEAFSTQKKHDAGEKFTLGGLATESLISYRAGYYRGYFNLKKVGDTFLNTEFFGKGQVYVNGHAIGRFWSIGPQQTLYVPGCWLKKGRNEVIVLDVIGPKGEAKAFCQSAPELDKLNLEKTNKHNDPGNRMDLNSDTPALTGRMAAGKGWQTIKLATPAKGRFFALDCLSTQGGGAQLGIAEVYLLDENGERINRDNWKAHYADSECGNSTLDKMFDLQESTAWTTESGAGAPHLAIVDMGEQKTVTAIEYLPRNETGARDGLKDFRFYLR